MKPLPRVRAGLLRHELDGQVLVYDQRGDRVHLLDPTTGCVLSLLEDGGWTREGIAAEVTRRLGVTPSESLLPLALEELRSNDLLESGADPLSPLGDVTRRELLRKAAMTGAAALLIPAIVTFTATPGYAQASAAGSVGVGGTCVADVQCTTGNYCYPGDGLPHHCVPIGCVPKGGTCTLTTQCCAHAYASGNLCVGSAPQACKN